MTKFKKHPIGLEMFAVRNSLMRDLPGTVREVAKMGYEAVEFYAPYLEWTIPYAKDVRRLMDDVGLRCHSTHNAISSLTAGPDMDKAIGLNLILGSRTIVLATAPETAKGFAGWRQFCVLLTNASEQLKSHGLSAGYHNHQADWALLDEKLRYMDYLAAHTPRDFMLQFDVGTCIEAGADPVAWIKANPGRIRSVHLKDWAPGSDQDEKGYRTLFGEGIAPWREICAAAEDTGGVEFYIMEQEGSRFPDLEAAQLCLNNWRRLRGELSK